MFGTNSIAAGELFPRPAVPKRHTENTPSTALPSLKNPLSFLENPAAAANVIENNSKRIENAEFANCISNVTCVKCAR